MRHHKHWLAAVAAAAVLTVSGCGISTPEAPKDSGAEVASDFDALVTAAKAEGTLTIYSSDTEEHLLAIIEGFQTKYGITVEYVRLASAAVGQRYVSERDAGVVAADVIQLADPSMITANPEWFVALDKFPLESLDNYLPKYKSEYHAAGVVFPSGLQYNTDLVKPNEVPKTYKDLLSPRFAGKILLVDPNASPTPLGLLNILGEKYGDDFISKLGKQNLGYVDSASPGAQQVAAGAYEINFPTAGGAQTAPLKASGAPIDYVVLEPVQVGTNELALSADSQHPNAGALFLNYRFSHEAFELICATNPQYGLPFEGKIKGCIDIPGDPVRTNFALWSDQAAKDRILDLLGH